jgi:hypothetical protein
METQILIPYHNWSYNSHLSKIAYQFPEILHLKIDLFSSVPLPFHAKVYVIPSIFTA